MISGIYTAILLIIFLAIVAWAWSSKNKKKFDKYARMPLNEDNEKLKTKDSIKNYQDLKEQEHNNE